MPITRNTEEAYIIRRISLVNRSSSYLTQDSNSILLLSILVLRFHNYRDPDLPLTEAYEVSQRYN
jgi:hypothetical protein